MFKGKKIFAVLENEMHSHNVRSHGYSTTVAKEEPNLTN